MAHMQFVYTFSNPELLFTKMKHAMKDHQRGVINRTECATILEEYCKQLTQGQEQEVVTLFEMEERLRAHLGKDK